MIYDFNNFSYEDNSIDTPEMDSSHLDVYQQDNAWNLDSGAGLQDPWQHDLNNEQLSLHNNHDLNWQDCHQFNEIYSGTPDTYQDSFELTNSFSNSGAVHFGSSGESVVLDDDNYVYDKDAFIESADGTLYKSPSDYTSGTNGYEPE